MSRIASPQHQPTQPAADRFESIRRSPLFVGAAVVLCGLGLAASGVTLVRAADDAGVIALMRSDYLNRVAEAVRVKPRAEPVPRQAASRPTVFSPPGLPLAPPQPPAALSSYASAEPAPARKAVPRKARVALTTTLGPSIAARRTVCVRTCDGYAFPLGNLQSTGDLAAHKAACSSACPGAETALYTLAPGQRSEDTAQARSVATGAPYRRLATAFRFQKERVASCSCHGPDNVATRLPILLDPTLRSGDVFVDKKGAAKVYAGRGQLPHSPRAFADFRASPVLNRQAQAQVDRVMGVSQREARARAFERAMAVREAAARRGYEPGRRIREASLREVAAPSGSGAGVRMYQVTMDGGRTHASGARIIEVR